MRQGHVLNHVSNYGASACIGHSNVTELPGQLRGLRLGHLIS